MRVIALFAALSACAPLRDPSAECPVGCPSTCADACFPSGSCREVRVVGRAAGLVNTITNQLTLTATDLPAHADVRLTVRLGCDPANREERIPWDYWITIHEGDAFGDRPLVADEAHVNETVFPVWIERTFQRRTDAAGVVALSLFFDRCGGRGGGNCLFDPASEFRVEVLHPEDHAQVPSCE